MERKLTSYLQSWKDDPDKVALIVKGARQIGKTYTIDEFGRTEYGNYLILDMRNGSLHKIFENYSASEIINRMTTKYPWFRIEPGNSLLFIDEIQECPDAIMAMKPLVMDGRIHVVGSGSMLGIHYKPPESYPVGYVHEIEMHPMDFEEYLWSIGMSHEQTNAIRRHVSEKKKFDPYTLHSLNEYFRQYMVVGGMPLPVLKSIGDGGMGPVIDAQNDIINGYRSDITAYANRRIDSNVRRIFELVPVELARPNKRLRFKDVEDRENTGIREYGEPVDWLEGSRFVNLCYKLRNIERPLGKNCSRSMFKMYMLDTGLLVNMLGDSTREAITDDDISINEGAIAENAVCSMLVGCGIRPYYLEKEREIEIDFIAEIGAEMCAIEVKSGKKRRARSLKKLMEMPQGKTIDRWIKFEYGNIMVTEDGVEHYPLFCASFADSLVRKNDIRLKKASPDLVLRHPSDRRSDMRRRHIFCLLSFGLSGYRYDTLPSSISSDRHLRNVLFTEE